MNEVANGNETTVRIYSDMVKLIDGPIFDRIASQNINLLIRIIWSVASQLDTCTGHLNSPPDTINTGGGDDVINAGGGNDKMTGGTGSDDFIFKDGFGTDIIYDFDVSNVDENIDLSTVTGITNYTDLKTNHLRSNSTNEAEIFDEANTITLAGVSTADLSDTDFIF